MLEEDLDLAAAEDGLLLLPRVPYLAGERLGNTILDVCRLGDAVGGYRPSLLTEEVGGGQGGGEREAGRGEGWEGGMCPAVFPACPQLAYITRTE